MAGSYAAAAAKLYQAPLDQFVTVRKQLAAELKSSGDAAAAARLSKLGRPPVSAWAVNQLWWRERDAFEQLFAAAERVRQGELATIAAHRDALATLRLRAAKLISEAGHAATEATLRRVATTLASLAAAGGFEPDASGALTADRDPPGFEEGGFSSTPARPHTPRHAREPEPESRPSQEAKPRSPGAAPATKRALEETKRREAEAAARKRAEAEAERRRLEEERKRVRAERRRLETALRAATERLDESTRSAERLRKELASAERGIVAARAAVDDLETELQRLPDPE